MLLARSLGSGQPFAAQLALRPVGFGETLEAHAAQNLRRFRELDVAVADDLDVVSPGVDEGETASDITIRYDPAARQAHYRIQLKVQQTSLLVTSIGLAANHAGGTVEIEDGLVRLVVEDDGAGFSTDDLDQRRREGHVGLELLRGLLRDAGGALRVDSTPGRGTRVAVEVPVA